MYFSYVPSIIFSFFNHPLFLNLLFKQILIQYYSILFNRVLRHEGLTAACRGRPGQAFVRQSWSTALTLQVLRPERTHPADLAEEIEGSSGKDGKSVTVTENQ